MKSNSSDRPIENQCTVVFVDNLAKWPEVFPVLGQSTAIIATLLVEEIVSRHAMPKEILRGKTFMSRDC